MGGPALNLDAEWADLEQSPRSDTGHLRARVPIGAPVHLYLAIAEPSGCRVLALAFDDDVDVSPIRTIRLRGLDVSASPFVLEGQGSTIALATRSTAYNGLFARLVDDLVGTIDGVESKSAVIEALGGRLETWQRFLEEVDPGGLSVEAQTGLFGELWFLRDHLLKVLGPSAVTAWQGPLRAIQDFQAQDWAIEVKTTRQAAPAAIRIANERQLQGDGLATLALVLIALEQRADGSPTLVDMVASVRAAVIPGSPVSAELEDRLLSAGYLDEQADLYRGNAFALRWTLCSLVAEGFPRITEHDLPAGIGDVSYSIAVDSCREYEIGLPLLWQRIAAGAS